MTDQELSVILVTLDNVWGGLDPGLEAGYRWVLGELDPALVEQTVREMAHEDRHWLPKAPEIAARVHTLERDLERDQRRRARLRELEDRLELEARALRAALPPPEPKPSLKIG